MSILWSEAVYSSTTKEITDADAALGDGTNDFAQGASGEYVRHGAAIAGTVLCVWTGKGSASGDMYLAIKGQFADVMENFKGVFVVSKITGYAMPSAGTALVCQYSRGNALLELWVQKINNGAGAASSRAQAAEFSTGGNIQFEFSGFVAK